MTEFQVEALLGEGSPPRTHLMQVHPVYSPEHSLWLVNIANRTFAAPTLRQLQAKLPTAVIQDYYPDGYHAEREGFLQPYEKVRWHPTYLPATTQRVQIAEAKKAEVAAQQPIQSLSPREQHRELLQKYEAHRQRLMVLALKANLTYLRMPKVDHEALMVLIGQKLHPLEVAIRLNCSISTISCHLTDARKAKDPRAPPGKYKMLAWTAEDDVELAALVAQGLSAAVIGKTLGRSKNAVIGRCHRKGYELSLSNGRVKV